MKGFNDPRGVTTARAPALVTPLLIVPLASFVTPYLASSINVALPAIGSEFDLDAVSLGWFNIAYLIAAAVLLLPTSRLSDILGRRRFFLAGLAILILGSLALPFATSGELLIALRLVQGIGGAFIFATSHAIMFAAVPTNQRGLALGINVTAVYLGLTCGPVIGGVLTHHFGWRSIFYLASALSGATLVLCARYLRGETALAKGESFDFLGALLLAGGLAALILGSGANQGSAWLILLGIAAMVLFLARQRRARSPLLDLGLLTANPGVAMASLSSLLLYCGTSGVTFLLSLYLQYGRDMNPQQAGLVLLAQPAAQVAFAALAGRLSDAWQPRDLTTVGGLLCAGGLLLLSLVGPVSGIWLIVGGLALLGLGIASFSAPNTNAAMSAVPARQLGVAGGLLQTVRLLGQMMSMGIAMAVFAVALGGQADLANTDPQTLATTLGYAYGVFLLLALGSAAVSFSRPIRVA